MLGLYANDVLCRTAIGRGFSEGGDYDRHGFQKMFEEYQELLGGFSIGDFFPSMEFIHSLTGMKSRLQHTFRCFDQLFDEIIKEHLNPEREKEEHKDLIDVLLDTQKNGEVEIPLTMDNVKAIMLVSATFPALTDLIIYILFEVLKAVNYPRNSETPPVPASLIVESPPSPVRA
ncbi:Cytochrome P450 [Dillenia turbinata]|uniref:Cytochrome P450 n=1 Tax=Dillenia turbinata TaxID=194707 RepID=A0AAN8VCC2_9MAGN